MASVPCPDCGERIHRSHARGFNEKLVRSFTPYRTYRCHECGWRGWLTKSNSLLRPQTRRTLIQTGISLLATIILTFLLLYLSNII